MISYNKFTELLSEAGNKNKQLVLEKFNWATIAQKTNQVYLTAINKKQPLKKLRTANI